VASVIGTNCSVLPRWLRWWQFWQRFASLEEGTWVMRRPPMTPLLPSPMSSHVKMYHRFEICVAIRSFSLEAARNSADLAHPPKSRALEKRPGPTLENTTEKNSAPNSPHGSVVDVMLESLSEVNADSPLSLPTPSGLLSFFVPSFDSPPYQTKKEKTTTPTSPPTSSPSVPFHWKLGDPINRRPDGSCQEKTVHAMSPSLPPNRPLGVPCRPRQRPPTPQH
jgi:hypothetical protein